MFDDSLLHRVFLKSCPWQINVFNLFSLERTCVFSFSSVCNVRISDAKNKEGKSLTVGKDEIILIP